MTAGSRRWASRTALYSVGYTRAVPCVLGSWPVLLRGWQREAKPMILLFTIVLASVIMVWTIIKIAIDAGKPPKYR